MEGYYRLKMGIAFALADQTTTIALDQGQEAILLIGLQGLTLTADQAGHCRAIMTHHRGQAATKGDGH